MKKIINKNKKSKKNIIVNKKIKGGINTKKVETKYIVGSIILIIVLLGVIANFAGEDRKLNFFESTIKDTGVFIQKVINAPIKFVGDKVKVYKEAKSIYKEYTKLKEKVEKSELYYAQIQELQNEIDNLKETLKLNSTLSEYEYVNANVINRNVGYWYNTLNIDKGIKDGIEVGDAVIVNKGLIGKINKVGKFSSTVKLLTTDEISNKISIKIQSSGKNLYGLLIGYDKSANVYKVEGISESKLIKENDIVTTTGLTDYFPSGILIGYVKSVTMDEYDLSSIVEVTPSVDFDNINIVTVLNRKAMK